MTFGHRCTPLPGIPAQTPVAGTLEFTHNSFYNKVRVISDNERRHKTGGEADEQKKTALVPHDCRPADADPDCGSDTGASDFRRAVPDVSAGDDGESGAEHTDQGRADFSDLLCEDRGRGVLYPGSLPGGQGLLPLGYVGILRQCRTVTENRRDPGADAVVPVYRGIYHGDQYLSAETGNLHPSRNVAGDE